VELAGGGAIYPENTPEELAAALAELLSDPAKMERLSRAGREGVEKHFHIDVQAERMLKVYKNAVNTLEDVVVA
jgi:glycosyltransferase involved in cell wall biosynthesis